MDVLKAILYCANVVLLYSFYNWLLMKCFLFHYNHSIITRTESGLLAIVTDFPLGVGCWWPGLHAGLHNNKQERGLKH